MDHMTSDELFLELSTSMPATLSVYTFDYEVCHDVDNSLHWLTVERMRLVGCLWTPGMTRPMLKVDKPRKQPTDNLKQSDPFDVSRPKAKPSSNRARGSRGGHGGGRGRGRGGRDNGGGSSTDLCILDAAPVSGIDVGALDPGDDANFLLEEDLAEIMDNEHDSVASEDIAEMEEAYESVDSRRGLHQDLTGVGMADPPRGDEFGVIDEDLIDEFVEVAGAVGLGESEANVDGAEALVDGVGPHVHEVAPSLDAPPPERLPWEDIAIPESTGYVYHEGKHIVRFQRDNPVGSMTITCYNHPGCRWLTRLRKAPSNLELVKWSFAMAACTSGMSKAEKKEMTRRHIELGKALPAEHGTDDASVAGT